MSGSDLTPPRHASSNGPGHARQRNQRPPRPNNRGGKDGRRTRSRECGERLNQAKAQVVHGGFTEWLQAHCRVKPRQAQKYMKLAREWPAIEAKCASNAHLTIDEVLRPLDRGRKLTQRQIAEFLGVTARTVQRIVAEQREQEPTMSGSENPFDVGGDPFGEEGGGEESETEFGQDADRSPGSTKTSVESSDPPDPEEEFRTQRSKTIKTVEATMRAFDDLQRLRTGPDHSAAINQCKSLLTKARNSEVRSFRWRRRRRP